MASGRDNVPVLWLVSPADVSKFELRLDGGGEVDSAAVAGRLAGALTGWGVAVSSERLCPVVEIRALD